ncbi:MAG: NADH-quinone oxidoreductase subunit N, partial [Planctomycetes bacterium]|nr:NADH-quinone oxidoreductase subunit N [Planctomycetota bacterium]
LFAALAMMFMASATDFLMIFLATEFASLVSYILVGFLRRDLKSNEAAVKYFLVGSFCAAIMLYGISLVYGLTGSTHIAVVGEVVGGELEHGLLLTIAVFCILAGLGFKIAMAPFHFWAPDAFEGAPTPVTAFISVAPKAAGLAVLLRVFCVALPLADVNAQTALAVLSAVTMTVGNLMAIPQNNVKRLFAYSSIAHIGYILIGLVVADQIGLEGVLIYVLAYVFMNLGAFACVIAISNRIGSDDITNYGGISERSMPLALIFIVFLLSLAGLPPTAGFVGKFVVFAAAIKTGYVWLAVIAIMNSVISVYYYFRIAYYMYFKPAKEATALEVGESLKFALTVTLGMTLLIGILPGRFLANARAAVHSAVSSQPAPPTLDIKTIQALDVRP